MTGVSPFRYAIFALCTGVLIAHALQYNFITDDAYISFVYARNLAERGALVFNQGDRVEGYTNFLWTFTLGLLMKVGLAPTATAQVLGLGFATATLAVAMGLVHYLAGRASGWDLVAPALLALSSGFACWSSGGLETQMFTFWVSLALYCYVRGDREPAWMKRVGPVLALAAMTRPEGLLIACVLGAHRLGYNLVRHRRAGLRRQDLWAALAFVVVWGPWFAWRWSYYGHPFPNTYYVKAAGETASEGYHRVLLANGAHYVWQWLWQTKLAIAAPLTLAGLFAARVDSPRFLFGSAAALVAGTYLAYTISVGGDFLGLHRFILPLFVIAAVAVVLGLRLVVSLPTSRRARGAAAGLGVTALLLLFAVSQVELTRASLAPENFASDQGIDTPAFLKVFTRDRAAIGTHMVDCFRPGDFSIVGGAGAQPYYARMEAIDVFGLVSWDIAHCQPRLTPRAGHNKWGEMALLRAQPRPGVRSCPEPRGGGGGWGRLESGPPEFVFACYSRHRDPHRPGPMCHPGPGYEMVTLHIGCSDEYHTGPHPVDWTPATPEMVQDGARFYSFWVTAERRKDFRCRGLVR